MSEVATAQAATTRAESPLSPPFAELNDLHVTFAGQRRWPWQPVRAIHAVRDVSFAIAQGSTFGLVGESGSGKSTVARAMLRLLQPHQERGSIRVANREITSLSRSDLFAYRRQVQAIFQDPYTALNPAHVVGAVVGELLTRHRHIPPGRQRDMLVGDLLSQVGLTPEYLDRFPYELSGGQRQRVAIARALAVEPQMLVCDEPTSALDVSVQAQVINMLLDIQQQRGVTYLFIGHNLEVVRHISSMVGVMYHGYLVESGPIERVYTAPAHPYTRMLLEAVPLPDPVRQRERADQRRVYNPAASTGATAPVAQQGCPFQHRCPLVHEQCRVSMPPTMPVQGGGTVRCYAADDS